MPQHDPTPIQEGIAAPVMPMPEARRSDMEELPVGTDLAEHEDDEPEVRPTYATRTEKREAIVAGWREDMLSHLTPLWLWSTMALTYLVVLGAAIWTGDAIVAAMICAIATAAAWWTWWTLSRRDDHYRVLAALTPVVDRSTLQGEATILTAAVDALSATLRNPASSSDVRLRAMQVVLSAARPMMLRGGVETETATVDGYPAWPEVDRTEMPGEEGDFLSVHLIRLDATAKSAMTAMSEEVIFQETIARIAGGVVPPLRAMEAVIEEGRTRA